MPSAAERAPSTTSSSSSRRLLSRFTSPFTSRSRNISEFVVETEEPLKQHCPGDVVKGSVKLRIAKPTRVQHIVVCLHGYVQVYRNPGSPGDGYRSARDYLGTGRGKKAGEYFGNGFASLFEDEVVLCGDGRLGEGLYQFQFELDFPDRDLPSSIEVGVKKTRHVWLRLFTDNRAVREGNDMLHGHGHLDPTDYNLPDHAMRS